MKKLLLSILCLVGFVAANAAEVSVTFSEKGYANGQEVTTVALDDNITLLFDKGSNSNACKYYNTGTAMRVYGGGTMTVQGASGVTISKVTIATQSSNPAHAESAVSAGTLTISTTETVIDGVDGESVMFTQGGTSGHIRMVSVKVEYTVGVATKANAPVITPNGGEISADTEISIESTTEGAKIYYTIDGTDPNFSSLKYKEPIQLDEGETVVKAISVNKKGVPSLPESKTYVIELPIEDAPAVSPSTGQYDQRMKIEIKIPEGYTAYYTMDGSTPTTASTKYTGPINMPENDTLFKAILVNAGGRCSGVTTRNYILDLPDEEE